MAAYDRVLRPLLFHLPPETAHRLAEFALRRPRLWGWALRRSVPRDRRLHTRLAGIPLESPIGLAAGYDKDCRELPGLARLGPGYIVAGTVLPAPAPGNPRPRMLRLTSQQALLNSLGFPSRGGRAAARGLRGASALEVPVVVSIAALSADEFQRLHRLLEPLASAVELNISSPNTEGLAAFQRPRDLDALLERLARGRRAPLFVKLPAAYDHPSRDRLLGLAEVCLRNGLDGVTAGNARMQADSRLKVGKGGLSGRPLLEDTLRTVSAVRERAGPGLAINACGGVFTGEDAFRALRAGATTVQVLTALVYRGPGAAIAIARELLACLDREGSPRSEV